MNYLDAQMNKMRELKTELKNQHEENARLQQRRTTFPHKNVSPDNTRDLFHFFPHDMVKCTQKKCVYNTYIF